MSQAMNKQEESAAVLLAELDRLNAELAKRKAAVAKLESEIVALKSGNGVAEAAALKRLKAVRPELLAAQDALEIFTTSFDSRKREITEALTDLSPKLHAMELQRAAEADRLNSEAYADWQAGPETAAAVAHLAEGWRLSGDLDSTFADWLASQGGDNAHDKLHLLLRDRPLIQPEGAEHLEPIHDRCHKVAGRKASLVPPRYPLLTSRHLAGRAA